MVKIYGARLILRIAVLVTAILMYLTDRNSLFFSKGLGLEQGIQPLHILWLIFAAGMVHKFFPQKIASMGCRKQFKSTYAPSEREPDRADMAAWIKAENGAARKVLAVWVALHVALALLYDAKLLGESEILLLSLIYYVCDLICVLFYCPFQSLIMKNRCCVTCRIFNWDSMMMVTPLILVPSFFSWSLGLIAFMVLIRWEVTYRRHPLRFSDACNKNLHCTHCRERLCVLKRSVHVQ
ncbi:hypothetical protein EDC14_105726 [Hydrogenispora ethanolica]|uniref:Uncharacterized protein n=1 Tax=Hydrogenispora ethanolica TaxID=1082276 RepID=A0A4R1QN41_HYDET|nr:hypothetical protein [Hydrogenispora ethanolica]TCL55158.1 hypothetical protein EDC14_105726 [Hydrogenispora ethanolica]